MLAPMVRASTSAWYCVTWWSPNATCRSTTCRGVPGSGSSHVLRHAVGLAAVPQHLHEVEGQRALLLVRVPG